MKHTLLTAGMKIALLCLVLIPLFSSTSPLAAETKPPVTSPGAIVRTDGAKFTIEQTLSDGAQRTTIAFDGLAFLSGSLGADSFFPPGKVADFWGFQYLRDNDPSEMGHNTDFLTKASLNMLYVLTTNQRAELVTLANQQVSAINDYGYKRFVLMKAFRRLLEGDLPAGTTGLDKAAVMAYSAELYRLDGQISYERAQVMGRILKNLDATQRAYLDAMVGQGMTSWPTVDEPVELRGLSHDAKVAVMTYAGDLFSWYAGDVEADVYFCPERQGTYFGSFYMKDAPAVGNPGYSIGTNITADMGNAFLAALTPTQAESVTSLVELQRTNLYTIVDTRRSIATQLRKFIAGETADSASVLALSDRYGALDGEIVYYFATHFAQVRKTITDAQMATLMDLRTQTLGDFTPQGAFLYATEITMPTIPDTDFLFGNPIETPTLTPTPTRTQTPMPTATPTKTIAPTKTPTQTKMPTKTPTQTQTPKPTATPLPSFTPTATTLPGCPVAPDKPKLGKPANGAQVNPQQVNLDWADTNCATQYTLTVKQGKVTGKTMVSAQTIPSAFLTQTLPRGKTYYWQVAACNTTGCTASDWWSFKIAP